MNKNEERKQLREMSDKKLYSHIQELQNNKIKMEMSLRGGVTGGTVDRQGYTSGFKGNLRDLNRSIARAKTILLQRTQ